MGSRELSTALVTHWLPISLALCVCTHACVHACVCPLLVFLSLLLKMLCSHHLLPTCPTPSLACCVSNNYLEISQPQTLWLYAGLCLFPSQSSTPATQFNSDTSRSAPTPQVEGSVPQGCPTSDAGASLGIPKVPSSVQPTTSSRIPPPLPQVDNLLEQCTELRKVLHLQLPLYCKRYK